MSDYYSNINWPEFSDLLQKRRTELGLSQNKIAEEIGVTAAHISFILSGARRPSHQVFERFLRLLDIDYDDIPTIKTIRPKPSGKKIFVSYSHKDAEYLERLMVHLKPLQKQGSIDVWTDSRLTPGDRWKKEIDKSLKSARAAILLISADFIASDFIIENELPPILQAAEEKGTTVIPVIVKPCRFIRDRNLSLFQCINSPDQPLSLMAIDERELIYDTIAQRVEEEFAN